MLYPHHLFHFITYKNFYSNYLKFENNVQGIVQISTSKDLKGNPTINLEQLFPEPFLYESTAIANPYLQAPSKYTTFLYTSSFIFIHLHLYLYIFIYIYTL